MRQASTALDKGAVSSASIMMPTPWVTEVAAYARSHSQRGPRPASHTDQRMGDVSLGQRLAFGQIPSLLDSAGTFPNDEKFVAARAKPVEVDRELRAQIDRALAVGIRPTHLDSHMGSLFTTPELIATYVKVAHDYHLRFSPSKAARSLPPQAGISTQDVLLDG